MSYETFIKDNVKKELISQGFNPSLSDSCANKAVKFFKVTARFSGGAYSDCCNHAGELATQMSIGIKYKQVKAKRSTRKKRPQEAWNF